MTPLPDSIAKSWQLICGAGKLAKAGDHVVAEIAGRPLILVRGEEGTLRRFLHGPDGTPLERDAVVFALLREELPGSPVASLTLRAFDAAGTQVL